MNTFAISGLLCIDQFLETSGIEGLVLERILRLGDGLNVAGLYCLKPVGDVRDDRHLLLHAMVSRTCAAEIGPAAAGVARRESAVFDKDMIRVDLPEFRDDPVHLFLVPVDDKTKTGLLDHGTLRYLVCP